jgi:hypothetical protein
MSATSAEIVRAFYDLFVAGKAEEAAESYLKEDFVLTNPLPAPIPFGGRFVGADGFLQYLGGIVSAIEIEDFAIDEMLCDGDRVVVVGREKSLVKATGQRYEMEWVHVLHAVDGRIVSMREYNDTAAMRDAFEART